MAVALARDWRKAAWFYARFGITETTLRHRASGPSETDPGGAEEPLIEALPHPAPGDLG